jgi:replicative DNA helicase
MSYKREKTSSPKHINYYLKIWNSNILKANDTKASETISINLEKATIQNQDSIIETKDSNFNFSTGFKELDKISSTWLTDDVVVLAGRPAMGKTAFIQSIIPHLAVDLQKPIVIFSLEMSALLFVNRLISHVSKVSTSKLRSGMLNDDEIYLLDECVSKLKDAPIYIDDTVGISNADLKEKCRKMKKEKNIQLIVIDYCQLMKTEANYDNRLLEISCIYKGLKELAMEINTPIITLAQLSRAPEMRSDKSPVISDLQIHRSFNQYVDRMMFLYRPAYYGLNVNNDESLKSQDAEIIIAKNKKSKLGMVPLKFDSINVRFLSN